MRREDPASPDEAIDSLLTSCYCGKNGSLLSELESLPPHGSHVFKNDNAAFCVKIEESSSGASVDSTIKSLSRRKEAHSAFQSFISNHANEVKFS